jgi:WD40 repeat protein
VSGSDDQSVILWDVASGKPIKILREHADWVQAIAATDDGTMFASGSQEGTIKVWDADSLECLRTLRVGRLYENMDITDVRGLTDGQIGNLIALGAGLSDKATGDLT